MINTRFPGINADSTALGFGCMRLPEKADRTVDEAEAVRMIRRAIDSGVRYVDTAYPYHGGQSEIVVGRALADGYREKVLLATKMPVWKVEKHEDMMALLDEQLRKLRVDHVDFYLLHALDKERFAKMKRLGYQEFYAEALAQGKIRFPAFSFHDNAEAFLTILNDYDWKMCQVQMNILDDHNQATVEGIRAAGRKGTGVVVMEPLRGGLLAAPPASVRALYEADPDALGPVARAFRYLCAMPEVVTILSGMSTMAQVEDNLRIFADLKRGPLTEAEKALYASVKNEYDRRLKTRCTGCSYCQPCPQGVRIPNIFQGYDTSLLRADGDFTAEYARIAKEGGDASRCVGCRKCERACPQHLPIVRYLHEIHDACAVAK